MAKSDIYFVPQSPQAGSDKVGIVDIAAPDSYQLDAVTQYTPTYTYQTTDHGVPSGATIADHVITAPFMWAVSGVLTPYSLVGVFNLGAAGFIAASKGGGERFSEIADALKASTSAAIETVNRKRDQLVAFAEDHTVLTIIGKKFQYSNMVIVGLTIPETPEVGDGYQVSVQFKQIRIAQTARSIGPITSVDASKLGASAVLEFAG